MAETARQRGSTAEHADQGKRSEHHERRWNASIGRRGQRAETSRETDARAGSNIFGDRVPGGPPVTW
jgi:hypothetical protein